VLSVLRADHEALRGLFSRYDRAGQDTQARGDACRALRERLRAHSHLEEEVLYPAVLKVRAREARAVVREALSEHQVLDGLLAELDQLEPEAPEYELKVQALRERVERHTSDAEDRVFVQARIHLTDARLETLGQKAQTLQGAATPQG
jgi:iron-sulfur cluster repair protein YtfE (RIC family)